MEKNEIELALELINKFKKIENNDLWVEGGYSKKVSYCIFKEDKTLYIFFEDTDGQTYNWFNNFRFAKEPYKDMEVKFKIHKGFLCEWKQIQDIIENAVVKNLSDIENILIFGWSLGGALATICHEDLNYLFKFMDIKTFTIGAPRPFAKMKEEDWEKIKYRFEGLTLLRNGADIVTHVPPECFGYKHVREVTEINSNKMNFFSFFNPWKYHHIDEYESSLKTYLQTKG